MTYAHKILLIVLFIFAGCSDNEFVPSPPSNIDLSTSVYCDIDIKNAIQHKTFKVHMFVSGLTQDNDLNLLRLLQEFIKLQTLVGSSKISRHLMKVTPNYLSQSNQLINGD